MEILLLGCGKMGSAMMNGWIKSGIRKSEITIVDPYYNGAYKSIADLPIDYTPDYILLAIKPQTLDEVLPFLKRFEKAVFISIMAGKTISSIQKELPKATIVRTMPNLPALVGKGVTAAIASKELSGSMESKINQLLEASGKVVWVKKEDLIDSVTAISGSGPAYVFLFAQSMIDAGLELGLDAKTAKTLVMETIKGSIELAEKSKESLDQLKINVTSKGGTTEAALGVLEASDGLKTILSKAARAAKAKAQQLST